MCFPREVQFHYETDGKQTASSSDQGSRAMSRTVLVTGGGGFIGSNLVKHFNREEPSWDLRVLDDFSLGLDKNLERCDCMVIRGSILDSRALNGAMKGADTVIHLAAIGSVPRSIEAPVPSHAANATGTLNVLEAARANATEHIIVASSSSVYGASEVMPRRETDTLRPMSPYAVTKLATESYANAYWSSYGLATLAFRFFNVYGPGQRADHPYAAVIPRFISAALSGKELTIYGDGDQARDFTYVRTVCDALLQATRAGTNAPGPVNLAFGSQTSLNELVGLLSDELKKSLPTRHLPPRPGDVRFSQADNSLLKNLLPDLKPTGLEVGLRETIQWFRRDE